MMLMEMFGDPKSPENMIRVQATAIAKAAAPGCEIDLSIKTREDATYLTISLIRFPKDVLELSDQVPLVNTSFQIAGGVPNRIEYRLRSGTLPQGVTLRESTGSLEGTPNGMGSWSVEIAVTDELGIHAEFVEATAFAWLAHRTLTSRAGNLPSATGARGARILGAIHRA